MELVVKALVPVDGVMRPIDAIQIGGAFWLVPAWIDNPSEGWTTPERIVALAGLVFHPVTLGSARILVEDSIPMSVLDGHAPPELRGRYTVVDHPGIRVPLPSVEP